MGFLFCWHGSFRQMGMGFQTTASPLASSHLQVQFLGKKAPENKYESEPYDEGVYGPLDNPTSLPYEATPDDDARKDTARGSSSIL